jgi:hypothetical protein
MRTDGSSGSSKSAARRPTLTAAIHLLQLTFVLAGRGLAHIGHSRWNWLLISANGTSSARPWYAVIWLCSDVIAEDHGWWHHPGRSLVILHYPPKSQFRASNTLVLLIVGKQKARDCNSLQSHKIRADCYENPLNRSRVFVCIQTDGQSYFKWLSATMLMRLKILTELDKITKSVVVVVVVVIIYSVVTYSLKQAIPYVRSEIPSLLTGFHVLTNITSLTKPTFRRHKEVHLIQFIYFLYVPS